MKTRIEQSCAAQALADRRAAYQRSADARAWARPAPLPAPPVSEPARSFWAWIGEQLLIPESHETAWMAFFTVAALLVIAIFLGDHA